MGADFFTETGSGSNVEQAFDNATEQSRYDHGSEGYTGTLAEKGDYTVVDRAVRWEKDAADFAETNANHPLVADKWGPAGAIPFAVPSKSEVPESRVVTVDVVVKGDPAVGAQDEWSAHRDAVENAVAAKVRLRKGERIVRTENKNIAPTYRATSVATEGKAVTRFVVDGLRGRNTWETGFASQSEARKALTNWITNPPVPRNEWDAAAVRDVVSTRIPESETYEVTSVTRRETGQPLVIVTRELVKAVYTVEVTVEKIVPVPNRIDGWLFFGWASS
jgi:hypothetical protein